MDTYHAARYHPILESFNLTPSFAARCDDSSWSNLDVGHRWCLFRLPKPPGLHSWIFLFFFIVGIVHTGIVHVELYIVVVLEECVMKILVY